MNNYQTLPKLLLEKAAKSGKSVAFRQKKLGIWNEIYWEDYFSQVRSLSLGLATELGFKKGDALAIVGDNRPHWVYAQLAAQSLGGMAAGIYQETLPEQLIFYINHCEAKIVVAEDQEQVDKLLEIESEIPLVEKIIYYNDKGMRTYKNKKLVYMPDLQQKGEAFARENSNYFADRINDVTSSDIAVISYTAGTTGVPKGVMLSHANLIAAADNFFAVDKAEENSDYLSFLPLAWIGEQIMSITASLYKNVTINFPEEPSTVLTDLREIGPHFLTAPPRTFENIISRFRLRIDGASWLKNKVYQFFLPYGQKRAAAKMRNEALSFKEKVMYQLGDYLVFSAIRDHLGLARIKFAYSSGGSLNSEAFEFFQSIGVNVKQCYGATETAGAALVQRDNNIYLNSVGVPLPNTEVKVDEKGELWIKSPSVFQGYLKDDASYHERVKDGWVSLGDRGVLDEDKQFLLDDSTSNLFQLSSGEQVAPTQIENKFKTSRYIKEAVIYGKDKPYLVSMINIDMDNVGRWAEKNQIVYTTYADLSMKEEVVKLIEQEIAGLMRDVPDILRIKKFVILHKELDADDQELTRTQKVRRSYVEEKYKLIFECCYSDHLEFKWSDAAEETDLKIVNIKGSQEVA